MLEVGLEGRRFAKLLTLGINGISGQLGDCQGRLGEVEVCACLDGDGVKQF